MSHADDRHLNTPTDADLNSQQLQRALQERNLYARSLADANRLYEEKLRELSALQRVGNILRNLQSVRQVCAGIVDIMVEEVGAENCSLMLLDRVRGRLTIRAARGRADAHARYFDAQAAPASFPLGEGVAGRVAQSGRPLLIPDVGADERFKPFEAPEPSVRSLLCLPLVESEQVWGVLNLSHPDIDAFTEDNERILSVVAGQAAIALANVQLFAELQRMNEALEDTVTRRTTEVRQKAGQLAVINRIAKTVNAALDPENALPEIVAHLARLVTFDLFAVGLLTEGAEGLRVLTVDADGREARSRALEQPRNGSILDQTLRARKPLVFERFDPSVRLLVDDVALEGGMLVPLLFQDRLGGFILLARRPGQRYTDPELSLIEELAQHVAAALEKSRLYKALVRMNEELESIVDARTRQLADSEQHYRTLFEQSGDGIFLADETGNIIEANGRYLELVGCPLESIDAVQLVRPEDGASVSLAELAGQGSQSAPNHNSLKLIRPDGDVRYVELNLNPVVLRNRLHVLGVAHDTTERRRLEEQLLRSEKLAAMGTLAASVAHEINNPLEGIKNCVNVLRRKLADTDLDVEIVDQIGKGIVRIRDIVRQILDFHRPGTEARSTLDTNHVLNEVLAIFSNDIRNRHVNLELKLAPTLPQIEGSVGRLQQVFTNIIMNALDAIEESGTLTVRTLDTDGEILVEFADSGCGIPPEDLDAVFQPFFTRKRPGRGTGLGLWISHSVIKEHGGRIEVDSQLDRGTTVSVFLPVMSGPPEGGS